MQLTKVRNHFHTLIDEVENPDLLLSFLELFKARLRDPESTLWNTLSKTEQLEVLDAFDESETESNLVSNQTMKKKYSKWLKK